VHIKRRLPIIAVLLACLAPLAAQAGRALAPEDWYRFRDVSDLRIAPDGSAVAYLVTSYDKTSDESRSALWTVAWNGGESLQLTSGETVSEPRFSPDGRYLSFLSARPAGGTTQLWVLDRRGGEARQVSHVSAEITGYEWSPDGRRVVLVMHAAEDPKVPKPLVVDAFRFKEDKRGYLTADSRTRLYLLDVRSGACEALTSDAERADSGPAFSPDGRQIGYVSNAAVSARDAAVDEIRLIAAEPGAKSRPLLSTWSPNRQRLAWSPDGTLLAFLQGDELKYNAYIMDRLAVAEVKSGKVRALSAGLDRAVLFPAFADDHTLLFAVEDDGTQYPAQVSLPSGAIKRLGGPIVVSELVAAHGHTAVLVSSDRQPAEVYALEATRLRSLSQHNNGLFAELTLGTVENVTFKSRDGTEIHGQIVKPPGYVPGRRYPTILWIHGGPNGQDDHSLGLEGYGPPLERQLFATHGYVVLAINYRGSSGRGAAFARSILADWGHKEVEDLLAGIDYAIAAGVTDPERIGVGGWSYGGILTDYVIASDTRFKAAISGAGSGDQLATYGADEYAVQYNAELGPPWHDPDLWLKVSYPFLHADRIHTPTLFMGGDKDFNVPIAGGEQMYQSLRTLGVPARLIVYPGEYHVLTRPSFLVDRFRRYLAWMDEYLPGEPPQASPPVPPSAAD
jgi:dipeptidyl aminopeptidase/acylaminoacyl peptidase